MHSGRFRGNGIACRATGAPIEDPVKQPLLKAVLQDGTTLLLATLLDGRCAILRNGDVIYSTEGTSDGIDEAVQKFLKWSRLETSSETSTR